MALDGVGSAAASADGGVILRLTVNGITRSFGTLGQGVRVVDVDGRLGNDTFTVAEALPIEVRFDGGTGTDTLQGPAAGTQWRIDAAGGGSALGITSFTGVENLVGGIGDDRFRIVVGGSLAGSLAGGAGTGIDELAGPDQINDWLISGVNSGNVNGTVFTGIELLTGGTNNDTFRIATTGSITGGIDGGVDASTTNTPPVDTLSYAAWTTAVRVDLSTSTATSVAGFSRIDAIIGGDIDR